jgi:pantetheine-phosphate adenylyltransferase
MKAVYPISGKPIHVGHLYVLEKALKLFDDVTILIACNSEKENIPTDIIKWIHSPLNINIDVCKPGELVVEYCESNDIQFIVRGLRGISDIDYELNLNKWNSTLNRNIETVFIPTCQSLSHVSSSSIRQLVDIALTRHDTFECQLQFAVNTIGSNMNQVVLARYMHFKSNPSMNISDLNTVYIGKSCMGKSTYIKSLVPSYQEVTDLDKIFWGIVPEQLHPYKLKLSNCMRDENVDVFLSTFKELHDVIKYSYSYIWDELKFAKIIDFAAYGAWYKAIPLHIRSLFNIVYIETTNEKRKEFIKSKGFDKIIDFIDKIYKEPDFYDKKILIT